MISSIEIDGVVTIADAWSDRGFAGLRTWADLFIEAHTRCPGGLSLEFGTRLGGSALMFLSLLDGLYPTMSTRPQLFTVDPYGNKPYKGGDHSDGATIYGDELFTKMKDLLKNYPNHAHWKLTSGDFLTRLGGARFWTFRGEWKIDQDFVTGAPTAFQIGEPARMGQKEHGGGVTFALLDGDHDSDTIELELMELSRGWMLPGAIIVVDNADCSTKTWPMLQEKYNGRSNLTLRTPWEGPTAVLDVPF